MRKDDFYQDKTGEREGSEGKEELMPTKGKRRSWSVAALVFGILSIIFSTSVIIGIVIGLIAIGLAVVSRIKLGYFDRLSILALVFGVFGLGVCTLLTMIALIPPLNDFVNELLRA